MISFIVTFLAAVFLGYQVAACINDPPGPTHMMIPVPDEKEILEIPSVMDDWDKEFFAGL